ncbi:MAG: hypothetical protein ABI411_15705 [Tahibacter sp.]
MTRVQRALWGVVLLAGMRCADVFAAGCGLPQPAFCEDFESGPSALSDRGRGNELSRSRFSVSRYAPSLSTGDGVTFWAWEAEFGMDPNEPLPCRADVVGFLLPTRDTLVCEPSTHIGSRYLFTAVGSQNYGSNAYRIRQPFDFAGRTGKVVFDTDLATNFLLGYSSVVISEDPSQTPSWDVNGRGPNPRNGLLIVFLGNDIQVHDVRDHVMTTQDGMASGLPQQRGRLTRVELRLSQQQLEVLTSEPSNDGITFSPLVSRRVVVFSSALPFSRGYVSLLAHNHATWKYAITFGGFPRPIRSWNTYWDNVGFDGPAILGTREYEVPAANIPSSRNTIDEHPAGVFTTVIHPGLSLGYVIPNGPATMGGPLIFGGVSLAHATRARLVFNGYYQGYDVDGIRLGTGRLRYQLNDQSIHVRAFTPGEVAMLDTPGQTGGYNHSIDIPLSELVEGSNSVRFSTLNISSGYPNGVTNLDLLIDADGDFVFGTGFQ